MAEVKLSNTSEVAEVFIDGAGTCCTPHDSPIFVEFYDGSWVLHVWADINQEDPTHRIDLSGAFEERRHRDT